MSKKWSGFVSFLLIFILLQAVLSINWPADIQQIITALTESDRFRFFFVKCAFGKNIF